MKDINKLKPLLARHKVLYETDKLSFYNRIKSEHSFQSIQDCIEYISIIINNKPINLDNILPVYSEAEYDILKINIIDEAVCSIIYEIFHLIWRNNKEVLEYSTKILEDFNNSLFNKIKEDKDSKIKFYRPLFMIIVTLISLCEHSNLENDREEFYKKQLAYYYYKLMYDLYDYVSIKDNYTRTLQNYYQLMFFRHENWL